MIQSQAYKFFQTELYIPLISDYSSKRKVSDNDITLPTILRGRLMDSLIKKLLVL